MYNLSPLSFGGVTFLIFLEEDFEDFGVLDKHKEFSGEKFLSETIIPWAIEWLYYYEIWLVTGTWNGGGEHPNV